MLNVSGSPEYQAAARSLEALKRGDVYRVTVASSRHYRPTTLTRVGEVRTVLGPWPEHPDLVHVTLWQVSPDGTRNGRTFHVGSQTLVKIEPYDGPDHR